MDQGTEDTTEPPEPAVTQSWVGDDQWTLAELKHEHGSDDDAIILNLIAEVRELRAKLDASRRVGITLAEVVKQQALTLNEYDNIGAGNDD